MTDMTPEQALDLIQMGYRCTDPVVGDFEVAFHVLRAAASRPAVPEGYKLVPVEPTDEMCEALEECLRDHGFDHDGIGELSKAACWDALLAAAPEPASVSLEKSEAYIRGVSAGLHVGEEIGRRKSAEGDSE